MVDSVMDGYRNNNNEQSDVSQTQVSNDFDKELEGFRNKIMKKCKVRHILSYNTNYHHKYHYRNANE